MFIVVRFKIYHKAKYDSCYNRKTGFLILKITVFLKIGTTLRKTLSNNLKYVKSKQCGFTAGRSSINHIFTTRQLLEKTQTKEKESKKNTHDNYRPTVSLRHSTQVTIIPSIKRSYD